MPKIIPVYRKKIDLETLLPILDSNGKEIMEHVRDIIVTEDPFANFMPDLILPPEHPVSGEINDEMLTQ